MEYFSRGIALILLFLLTPLIILISVLCYFFQGRPLFFQQIRIGYKYKPFNIIKFKTMIENSGSEITSYGDKRIGIKIQNSITDKIPFSGFGYKNSDGTFKIGMRMWLDQGNYVKYVPYDNNYSINQHFMELIHMFQYEYPNLC